MAAPLVRFSDYLWWTFCSPAYLEFRHGRGGVKYLVVQRSYTINAVDASNCTQSTVVVITEPTALNITSTIHTNVTCAGASDGTITILATGGTPPLNYSLQPINQNNSTGLFAALPGNNYIITITDANNCSITTQVNASKNG